MGRFQLGPTIGKPQLRTGQHTHGVCSTSADRPAPIREDGSGACGSSTGRCGHLSRVESPGAIRTKQ